MLPGLAITNQPLNDAPSCAARSCLLFTQCDLPSLDAPSFSIFLYQRVTGPVFLQHGASTPPPPHTRLRITGPARYNFPASYHVLLQRTCSPVSLSVQKCHTCSPNLSVFSKNLICLYMTLCPSMCFCAKGNQGSRGPALAGTRDEGSVCLEDLPGCS